VLRGVPSSSGMSLSTANGESPEADVADNVANDDDASQLRRAYVLHMLNHALKARSRVMKHNSRLRRAEAAAAATAAAAAAATAAAAAGESSFMTCCYCYDNIMYCCLRCLAVLSSVEFSSQRGHTIVM
jgi:hypothetical protein